VLTHGFTVDAKGMKMSKSKGNTVVPQTVIKTQGADILRLWVAATDYRTEMNISDEILTRIADSYRRLRNTARYLLANIAGFEPARDLLVPADMLAIDRWALKRARLLQADIVGAYESYNFHVIYQRLHQFCSVELGGFYLDVLKDRVYTTRADSLARRSAQTAMYHILEGLARWMAPILSFTAEEIWRHIPGRRSESIFLESWYAFPEDSAQEELLSEAYWDKLLAVREQIARELEKARTAGVIGSSLEAEVDLYVDTDLRRLLEMLGDELRFVFIISEARMHNLTSHAGAQTELKSLRVAVKASAHVKCSRCWHRRVDVGSNTEHPSLCGRCVTNVVGSGEQRRYV